MLKLNIGSGDTPLDGYINIDHISEGAVKPDVVCNIAKEPLPYEDNSVDEIVCIHNIEHIEYANWPWVFMQFHRVLKLGGRLVLAYPEFDVCVKYFLENHRGMREFWRATLYGAQRWPGDYHVTPVQSWDLSHDLRRSGFDKIKWAPEIKEEFNTMLTCVKGTMLTKEDVIRKEVFNLS